MNLSLDDFIHKCNLNVIIHACKNGIYSIPKASQYYHKGKRDILSNEKATIYGSGRDGENVRHFVNYRKQHG